MSVDPFEQAMRETWQMVDPIHPAGEPGSYYRGEHNGICAALKTLRENYERLRAAVHKSEPFTKVNDAEVDAEIRRSGCLRTDENSAVVRAQFETARGVQGMDARQALRLAEVGLANAASYGGRVMPEHEVASVKRALNAVRAALGVAPSDGGQR